MTADHHVRLQAGAGLGEDSEGMRTCSKQAMVNLVGSSLQPGNPNVLYDDMATHANDHLRCKYAGKSGIL